VHRVCRQTLVAHPGHQRDPEIGPIFGRRRPRQRLSTAKMRVLPTIVCTGDIAAAHDFAGDRSRDLEIRRGRLQLLKLCCLILLQCPFGGGRMYNVVLLFGHTSLPPPLVLLRHSSSSTHTHTHTHTHTSIYTVSLSPRPPRVPLALMAARVLRCVAPRARGRQRAVRRPSLNILSLPPPPSLPPSLSPSLSLSLSLSLTCAWGRREALAPKDELCDTPYSQFPYFV
jgi:hypothetical protein